MTNNIRISRKLKISGTSSRDETKISSFLRRTIVLISRIGASEKTIAAALGRAAFIHHASKGPDNSKGSNPCDDIEKSRLSSQTDIPGSSGLVTPENLEEAGNRVQKALAEVPDLDIVCASLLLCSPLDPDFVATCFLRLGVPAKSMLAHPARSLADLLDTFGENPFTCEFKYDGMRTQIHCDETGHYWLYSRHFENVTLRYPDVISMISRSRLPDCRSFVIDGEIVAVESGGNKLRLLPLQALATRPKKGFSDAEKESGKIVSVCLFLFDLMYLNGVSYLSSELRHRRTLLKEKFREIPDHIQYAQTLDIQVPSRSSRTPLESKATSSIDYVTSDGVAKDEDGLTATEDSDLTGIQDLILSHFQSSITSGCEGLMAKSLGGGTAGYEPGERGKGWLKLKKDYVQGMADTIDVVPIGAWRGMGRKVNWYSPILLAVWDPDTETLQTLCKCMSGFSDAFYKDFKERMASHTLPAPRPYYRSSLAPSVWFDAVEVWEIAGADLTVSPVHTAGMGMVQADRGIGLRFPRFLRVREDKKMEDATTTGSIFRMFRGQSQRNGDGRPKEELEVDSDGL